MIPSLEIKLVCGLNYSSGGMVMPERSFSSISYGFSYQGSLKDDEIKGSYNSYTTLFRELDPRIVQWWTTDPEHKKTPWESPYVSMGNNPILNSDFLGNSPTDWIRDKSGKIYDNHMSGKDKVTADQEWLGPSNDNYINGISMLPKAPSVPPSMFNPEDKNQPQDYQIENKSTIAKGLKTTSDVLGLVGLGADGVENLGTAKTMANAAKNIGTYTFVGGVFVDGALVATGNESPTKGMLNTAVGYASWAIGGPWGLAIGATYFSLDKSGAFDSHGFINSTPHFNPYVAMSTSIQKPILFHHKAKYINQESILKLKPTNY